jgi:hypothetical protein
MKPDVFISYATPDRPFAERVCGGLEGAGLRCWIAPRDMTPGVDWSSALVTAIDAVGLLVDAISGHTPESRHVPREVEQSDRKGKAEQAINGGGGHFPYVASPSRPLAAAIVRWLAGQGA